MKKFIKKNTWLTRKVGIDFGWGNGYVLIPKGHKLHGKHYDEINVDVHGGLTFSQLVDDEMAKKWKLDMEDVDSWCAGFDTCHYGDTIHKWTKSKVDAETTLLLNNLKQI